jgi:hypothetical protein
MTPNQLIIWIARNDEWQEDYNRGVEENLFYKAQHIFLQKLRKQSENLNQDSLSETKI